MLSRKNGICQLMIVAAILMCAVSFASAVETDKKGEIGILGGLAATGENLAGDQREWRWTPVWGIRGGYFLSDNWIWFGDFTYTAYVTDFSPHRAAVYSTRTGVDLLLDAGKHWWWFVDGSVGWMKGDLKKYRGQNTDLSFNRGFGSIGFGVRRPVGEGFFSTELRVDRTVGHSGLEGDAVTNVQALLGYTWGLGGTPKDSDGDGVVDKKDACPDTPRGAKVDEKGCPMDSDGDGVYDGLDACPGTPAGWPVDARGCPKDSDGDGVADGADQCPDTPKGAKVDAKGCPMDSDGDGVYDGIDRCPDTPRGAKVDAQGCPMDSDGDGVYDGIDRCPDTPKGVKVDAQGCPVEAPKAPPLFEGEKKILVLEGVNFASDKADLTPESSATLDKVAASLKDWPEVKVEVEGHTDSTNTHQHNMKLSQARAESVRNYIVSKGVDPARLVPKGYGPDQPIADNKTQEGRAKNRRVELKKLN